MRHTGCFVEPYKQSPERKNCCFPERILRLFCFSIHCYHPETHCGRFRPQLQRVIQALAQQVINQKVELCCHPPPLLLLRSRQMVDCFHFFETSSLLSPYFFQLGQSLFGLLQ